MQNHAYSMKRLNNFQNASASDIKLFSHKSTVILHFSKSKHKYQNISENSFHPLFQEKTTTNFWHNSGALATITQPTKKLLSRYTAGFMNIFISIILTKILPFLTARYTILCTRRLQSPRDDCTVWVQWFSNVIILLRKRKLIASI